MKENERLGEWKELINRNEWKWMMIKWMDEWMNDRMNENEWMNYRMTEKINECKWMN